VKISHQIVVVWENVSDFAQKIPILLQYESGWAYLRFSVHFAEGTRIPH
jgi:hypothetical protein